jgi:hypothetical protein
VAKNTAKLYKEGGDKLTEYFKTMIISASAIGIAFLMELYIVMVLIDAAFNVGFINNFTVLETAFALISICFCSMVAPLLIIHRALEEWKIFEAAFFDKVELCVFFDHDEGDCSRHPKGVVCPCKDFKESEH